MQFIIEPPDWLEEYLNSCPPILCGLEEKMKLVLGLAVENMDRKSGGPFAAAIFDRQDRLLAAGVNMVELCECSILHAEMVAIAVAQKKLARFDIGAGGEEYYQLVSSTEPCAMCFGAVPWSGVSSLVCGARDSDARSIGFDEGPKRTDWPETLEARGIEVIRDVLRSEAKDVLTRYKDTGGLVYNPGNRTAFL